MTGVAFIHTAHTTPGFTCCDPQTTVQKNQSGVSRQALVWKWTDQLHLKKHYCQQHYSTNTEVLYIFVCHSKYIFFFLLFTCILFNSADEKAYILWFFCNLVI